MSGWGGIDRLVTIAFLTQPLTSEESKKRAGRTVGVAAFVVWCHVVTVVLLMKTHLDVAFALGGRGQTAPERSAQLGLQATSTQFRMQWVFEHVFKDQKCELKADF